MKTRKGIYYFPSYQSARDYAAKHGWPTNRIISYQVGWAIQLRVSGDYVGPNTVKSNPRVRSKGDKTAARELILFADNESSIYPQRVSIHKNLLKIKKGQYSDTKAAKLWGYWFEAAAKSYARQMADPADWNRIFSAATRRLASRSYASREGRILRSAARGETDDYVYKNPRRAKGVPKFKTLGEFRAWFEQGAAHLQKDAETRSKIDELKRRKAHTSGHTKRADLDRQIAYYEGQLTRKNPRRRGGLSGMRYQAYTLTQIRDGNARIGGHFFSKGATLAFKSSYFDDAVYPSPKKGFTYFVTSEDYGDGVARFKIRRYDWRTARIDTLGSKSTMSDAKAAAKAIAGGTYYGDVLENPRRRTKVRRNPGRRGGVYLAAKRGSKTIYFTGSKFSDKGHRKVFANAERAMKIATQLAKRFPAVLSEWILYPEIIRPKA